VLDIVEWSNALIQSAGITGVFVIALISAASILFFPVADLVYVPWAASDEVGLDPIQVGLAAGFASALGELVAYAIGRISNNVVSLRKRMVKKRKGIPSHTAYFVGGRWIKRHTDPDEVTDKYGFWAIPIFAFTPLPMDVLGIAMGYIRYNVFRFFLGTLIGKVPRCLFLALGLRFMHIPLWLILLGIVVFGALVLVLKRIRL
jgi:membrane protein YqaA with SNARE-associated domain